MEVLAGTRPCGSWFQVMAPHTEPGLPESWMPVQSPCRVVKLRCWKPVMSEYEYPWPVVANDTVALVAGSKRVAVSAEMFTVHTRPSPSTAAPTGPAPTG